MISSRQIKAARALLGWTQTELAESADLHLNAVNKIENETGEPRTSSLERIKAACETAGIRFRGQRGVELKENVFETLRFEGADWFRHYLDDLLSIVRKPEDEVLTCVTDERLFNATDLKQNQRYYREMKKRKFHERYLTSKKHDVFMNSNRAVYRWLPEKALGAVAYAVHGDRVAFIHWQTQEVLLIKHKPLSDSFRGQFEILWSQAKPFE